jgi:MoxR-like ATPase
MTNLRAFGMQLIENLEKVIVGKRGAIEMAVVGLLCQGHVLIEDVPGVGKTMLARSMAKSLGCSFKRLQFTPDMLPSDVTGVSIYSQTSSSFEFRPGPIFAQVVLVDEINRATPKTQAALLEAMEERQVTVDGQTHLLPQPFMVFATQNPIEYEGTFPLPEAQLDRFLLRIRLGYPAAGEEVEMLGRQQLVHPVDDLQAVASADELLAAMQSLRRIQVAEAIRRYVVDLTNRTRHHADIYLGASPRGSLGLFRAGQALAGLAGRDYVLPDDVKKAAIPVLAHRVIVRPAARLRELSAERIIAEILADLAVPGGDYELPRKK